MNRIIGSIALGLLPLQASAIGYLTCILPANQVAVSDELDIEFATRCFSEHLADVFGADANYFSMSAAYAKSNLESARANVALMPPEKFNATDFDLAIIVTAFGDLEDMRLDSGGNFQELAMVSAINKDSKIVLSQEMGEPPFVQSLKGYNFAALSMADDQMFQHFHLVGISCQ